jgi:hypothetical protein
MNDATCSHCGLSIHGVLDGCAVVSVPVHRHCHLRLVEEGWRLVWCRDEDAEVARLRRELEEAREELRAECDGARTARMVHGARDNETMPAFVDRIARERDALLAAAQGLLSCMAMEDRTVVDAWTALRAAVAAVSAVAEECSCCHEAGGIREENGQRRCIACGEVVAAVAEPDPERKP